MRTKLYIAILIVLFSGVLVGCQSVAEGTDLGTFIHYNNFAWRKYTPDTLHITLDIAENDSKQPVKLDLYKLDDDTGGYVPTGSEVQLFADGEACSGNVLTIYPGDTEIVLGLVFSPDAEEKEHSWIFKVVDMGELECVNNVEMQVGTDLTTMAMKAEMKHVWNPLALTLLIVAIAFGVFVLAWFAFLRRLFFPTFTFDNMQVLYFDGESSKGIESISLEGVRKVVCSSSPRTQGMLNRLVLGRVEYLTNPFWINPVEMCPFGADQISVQEVMTSEAIIGVYHMGSLITSSNSPKKPFLVKQKKTELIAKVSV